MPRSKPKVGETDIEAVARMFSQVRGQPAMRQLLDELLTPAELCDLALRWKLLKALQAGVPQRTIASELGISLCKITRGSRILKQRNSMAQRMLDGACKKGTKA
jgi:TrpR family trp operon transcriptional repressor